VEFAIAVPSKVIPKISVIIVTYRSTSELPGCIESVLRQAVPVEVFVVDNASPDHTPEMIAGFGERYDNVYPILNTENIGLAAGNNCPIGRCQGDYVLILNPDTVLPDDSLSQMAKFLDENPDVGVLGPQNVYENGTRHTSFHRNWGLLSVLAWRVLPNRIPRFFWDRFSSYKLQDVLFVSGSCLLIRRRIYEQIGGYDPEYFLTVEDVADLCIRARNTGSRVVFFPDVTIVHFTGRSGAQIPYIGIWQGNRGTVYHFLKHKGAVQAFLVLSMLLTSIAGRVLAAAALSVFKKQYRTTCGIYARVFWNLLVRNPIWGRGFRPSRRSMA
jgi:N-acetylglucosaminyl-diphospho-decaprenol L-rhamnosyltransferase